MRNDLLINRISDTFDSAKMLAIDAAVTMNFTAIEVTVCIDRDGAFQVKQEINI